MPCRPNRDYTLSEAYPLSAQSGIRRALVQVQEEAKRVLERLRRLDVVLPKYRQVASQLFELLRVRTLEEVVPAVEILVASKRLQRSDGAPEEKPES